MEDLHAGCIYWFAQATALQERSRGATLSFENLFVYTIQPVVKPVVQPV